MTHATTAIALLLLTSATLVACSSSTAPTHTGSIDAGTPHDAAKSKDTGAHPDGTGHEDAADRHDAPSEASACASPPPCTGSVSGGVTGALTTCTVSGQEGQKAGFGEVTFGFATASGATGSGNVSTKGAFAPGTYLGQGGDGGLWADAVGADSLWTVTWGDQMAECNGVKSPDEIDSLCAGATLDVKSVDACNDIHGTFQTTIPAYMGTPAVTIQLAF